jgi:hypothetical protein
MSITEEITYKKWRIASKKISIIDITKQATQQQPNTHIYNFKKHNGLGLGGDGSYTISGSIPY